VGQEDWGKSRHGRATTPFRGAAGVVAKRTSRAAAQVFMGLEASTVISANR